MHQMQKLFIKERSLQRLGNTLLFLSLFLMVSPTLHGELVRVEDIARKYPFSTTIEAEPIPETPEIVARLSNEILSPYSLTATKDSETREFTIYSLTNFPSPSDNAPVNIVTSIKQQIGGTCGSWATTALFEIMAQQKILSELLEQREYVEEQRNLLPCPAKDCLFSLELNLAESFENEVTTTPKPHFTRGLTIEEFYPAFHSFKADHRTMSSINFREGDIEKYGLPPQHSKGGEDGNENGDRGSYNSKMKNEAYNSNMFIFSNQKGNRIGISGNNVTDTVESRIRAGYPIYLHIDEWKDSNQEKWLTSDLGPDFDHITTLEFLNTGSGRHALAIVGYAEETEKNGSTTKYWIVKNSHGDNNGLLFIPYKNSKGRVIPSANTFYYSYIDDVIITRGDPANNPSGIKTGDQQLRTDSDDDGVWDIFDNATFCAYSDNTRFNDYNPEITNCANPNQQDIDEDNSREHDGCPYMPGTPFQRGNVDWDGYSNGCDPDYDGDGVSNENEGGPKYLSDDFLKDVVAMNDPQTYRLLNPFIRIDSYSNQNPIVSSWIFCNTLDYFYDIDIWNVQKKWFTSPENGERRLRGGYIDYFSERLDDSQPTIFTGKETWDSPIDDAVDGYIPPASILRYYMKDNVKYWGLNWYYPGLYEMTASTCSYTPNTPVLDLYDPGVSSGTENTPQSMYNCQLYCYAVKGYYYKRGFEEYSPEVCATACLEAYSGCSISTDRDCDTIPNAVDNCPAVLNFDQKDSDGDKMGDACDPWPLEPDHTLDTDGDGVPDVWDPCRTIYSIKNWLGLLDSDGDNIADICDNCPYKANYYMQAPDWNNEIIQGECRGSVTNYQNGSMSMEYCDDVADGGARYNQYGLLFGYARSKGMSFLKNNYWYWQPDHDFDGIGDVCDIKGQKGWGDRPGDGNYHTSIAPRALTESECLLFVPGTYWCFGAKSNWIAIDSFSGTRKAGLFTLPVGTADRYCWVPQDQYLISWGDNGYCTTSNRTTTYSRYSNDFAYSHGSDPFPVRSGYGNAWQEPTATEKTNDIGTYVQSTFWDWKSDLYDEYSDIYDEYVTNAPLNPRPFTLLDPFIRYAVSGGPTGTTTCTETNDLIDDGQGGKTQNPACFHNRAIFTRSTRDSFAGSPITYAKYFWVKQTGYSDPFVVPARLPFDVAHTLSEARPSYPIQDNIFVNWRYDVATRKIEKSQRIIPQEDLKVALSYYDETLFFYENTRSGTIDIKIQTLARPSDMAFAGSFALPRGIGPLTTGAILDDRLYLVIDGGLYHVAAIDNPQSGEHTHAATRIGSIPNTGAARHLIAAAHRLYLLTYESDGLTLYSFNATTESFDLIETATKPTTRDFTNVTVGSDGTIYFIGGMTVSEETATPHHDLWRYIPLEGLSKLADNLPIDLYTTFAVTEGSILRFITQPQQQTDSASAVVLDIATGTVTTEEVAIAERPGEMRDGYCIARNGNAVTGGIDLLWEGCHPFDDPAYKKYWFLDYKHSLAGKKDRLYVGGLTGIRVMKIEDDGNLTAEKLTILGTVSDMLIWGDYLYAVTGTKIHVLRIGTDGSLTKLRAVSTGGAVNLTRYGQFLIAAETKGAVFYNLFDDPTKPVKVFTIPTTYPALDVAVVGDRLAIYNDRFFATGRTVLYDLTNIETPMKLGETKKECDLAQFGEDRGTLYLGCWSGVYEVGQNASLTALSGDRAILRDPYERNGMVYQLNNGYITVSR